MPKVKKQRQHMIDAIQRRWSIDSSEDSSNIAMHDDQCVIAEDDVDNEQIDFSKESIVDDIEDLFLILQTELRYSLLECSAIYLCKTFQSFMEKY